MKTFVCILILLSAGCAPYAQVQLDLTAQCLRGVALLSEASESHKQLADELHSLRRRQLDDAFDADVMQRQEPLTASWVIEHRIAYALALDALARQRVASASANEMTRRNLDALDAALRRLQWLQTIQLRWSIPWQQEEHHEPR